MSFWNCFGLNVLLAVTACLLSGCRDRHPTASGTLPQSGQSGTEKPFDAENVRAEVVAFCGDCHGMPDPSAFSKEEWIREVARGYELYHDSGRFDLHPPRQANVVKYFQSLAPEKTVFDKARQADHPWRVPFRRQVLARLATASEPAASASATGEPPESKSAVAFILWQPPRDAAGGRLVFSDMHTGGVYEIELPADELSAVTLGDLGHPAIIEPSDLDADGRADYLVGDLGTFFPADHDKGRVLWLKASERREWSIEALAKELGRVAQAVAGDFDGDGDHDVLVAEFGWRKTGRILLLRRDDSATNLPQYTQEVVDPRHGTSHVRPLDWDGDGDLDFVALISQEHEKVELFVNDGMGKFRPETLFAAGDPAFGFSGFELVDLDGDQDLDVLLTNGDSMDSDTLKPSHAVRWLENAGKFPMTMHRLSVLPGAYKAVPGDIDGDGDLDIIAMAFPPMAISRKSPTDDLLVILEQTAPGEFVQHRLPDQVGGAALCVADFDGDRDLDLATGAFHSGQDNTWITVWWNEGQVATADAPAAPAASGASR